MTTITGASRGIGKALMELFPDATGTQTLYRGDELKMLDLRNIALINSTFSSVSEDDLLINNAAIICKKNIVEQTEEEIADQIAVNLTGTILLTRRFIKMGGKRIVFIGSDLSYMPMANMSVYVASKFGLRGFVSSLAKEHPELSLLLIHPRKTATDMNDGEGRDVTTVAASIYEHINLMGKEFKDIML